MERYYRDEFELLQRRIYQMEADLQTYWQDESARNFITSMQEKVHGRFALLPEKWKIYQEQKEEESKQSSSTRFWKGKLKLGDLNNHGFKTCEERMEEICRMIDELKIDLHVLYERSFSRASDDTTERMVEEAEDLAFFKEPRQKIAPQGEEPLPTYYSLNGGVRTRNRRLGRMLEYQARMGI